MQNKTCVITGATSGIGRAAALALGRLGANVILVGRNESRGNRVLELIRAGSSNSRARFMQCDLSSQEQVRILAEKITLSTAHIDVLVNNAGANFDSFQLSVDNIEMTFATNHLSHFLLTALLFGSLHKAPQARIISVAGDSHWGVDAEFEECLHPETFERRKAKSRSKLANLMFIFELADRIKGTQVTTNAVHPGAVATRLGQNNSLYSWVRHIGAHLLKGNLISSVKGADTVVYLSSSPEVSQISGKYFYRRTPRDSSPLSQDKNAQHHLWELSLKMTSLDETIGEGWEFFKPRATT